MLNDNNEAASTIATSLHLRFPLKSGAKLLLFFQLCKFFCFFLLFCTKKAVSFEAAFFISS